MEDAAMLVRVEDVERKLRAVCQSGELAKTCAHFDYAPSNCSARRLFGIDRMAG